jgi:hypothetical protein
MPVLIAIFGGLLMLLISLGMLIIIPILRVLFGAFGGWIVQITFGAWIVKGASVFGLTIPLDSIWAMAAFLAFVGGYFQSHNSSSSKSSD